jgi:cytochrome d ubiquinol oxidase subunit I
VEDAATANTGIWITFVGVVVLYVALGMTTILVLRQMSRRFREGGRSSEADVPYGPSEPDRADVTGDAQDERKVPLG